MKEKIIDYDGNHVVEAVRKAYGQNLPKELCFELAEIDHTIEGTKSQKETINFYISFIKNDRANRT